MCIIISFVFLVCLLGLTLGMLIRNKFIINVSSIIIASILVLFVFIFLSLFLREDKEFKFYIAKSINLSKENIEGIYLGDSIDDYKIKNKYENSLTPDNDNSKYNYYNLTDGIEIATNKDDSKIIRFIIDDENIKTFRGIHVGDNKNQIIKSYGKNYYKRVEQGADVIGYVDKDKQWSLEFWLFENNVIGMFRLDYKYME
ncbi:hypothetical protein [Romboutsia lituseburensis]|uniref:Uncharacterized protein n=1 Tax=Romboutsia lituseburensis DSM 797 TaxID=1121325 RepID=A0A1G9JDL7_9FIRM|nr:hypothetical protein [Romboutsia lituseburensis]CEH33533.1 Hypothetical protein RLITU_0932 [Romboutsia lituseburensis]SDL35528.1 hypothetical protein SAMN04515677_101607 [Romboutsia lituseburensis DSM 797]